MNEQELIVYNVGKGLQEDILDEKDHIAEEIMSAVSLPIEYEVLSGFPLRIEDQGSSSSCVGQATAKYAEVLEIIENKQFLDFSARFIYAQIYLPGGGAFLRDGMKILATKGIALEKKVMSYIQGINGRLEAPDEKLMTDNIFLSSQDILFEALNYRAKEYAMVSSKTFDMIKQAIYQNNGCLIGFNGNNKAWSKAIITPPTSIEWAHAVYARGWKLINGKEYLIIQNSWGTQWGDNGKGYIGRDYFENLSNILNPWTLIDNPNYKTMTWENVRLIYLFGLNREPDEAAKGYVGKSWEEGINLIMISEEFIEYDKIMKAAKMLENWARK